MSVYLNQEWLHMFILIDVSGSMQNLNMKSLINSLNKFIEEQKSHKSKTTATIAKFDDDFEVVCPCSNVEDINITEEQFQPRGMTALTSAMGRFIYLGGQELCDMTDERPGKVLFIVLSDGLGNVEKLEDYMEYRQIDEKYIGPNGINEIRKTIREQEDIYSWNFFFMGTNMDVMKVGKKYGFNPQNTIAYDYSEEGAKRAIKSCSDTVKRFRRATSNGKIVSFEGFTEEERGNCLVNIKRNIMPHVSFTN